MLEKVFIHLRYPYVLGIVSLLWFGTIVMIVIDEDLFNWVTLSGNVVLSLYLVWTGLRQK